MTHYPENDIISSDSLISHKHEGRSDAPFFVVFGETEMQYKAKEPDRDTEALRNELEPVIAGLLFVLVELSFYRSGKGNARLRLIVTRTASESGSEEAAGIGTEDLSRIHRAVLPRLELALPNVELYLEVSSPGTDRLIKEGSEFRCFTGKAIKCWCKDKWEQGILRGSDKDKIMLETAQGIQEMKYETIAKARLDG